MKTETIQLLQGTYEVPAEIGRFLFTCTSCGFHSNLYDMYNGGYAKALQDHDPEKARGILQGLAAAEEEKFIKFSLHKAIDELVESWPRQTKLLQTAQEQIRESFTSRYIREVLQRLEV